MKGYYFARRNGDKEDCENLKKKNGRVLKFLFLSIFASVFSLVIFSVFFSFFFQFKCRSEEYVEIVNQSSAGLFVISVRYFVKFLHIAAAIVYHFPYEQEKTFILHEGNFG